MLLARRRVYVPSSNTRMEYKWRKFVGNEIANQRTESIDIGLEVARSYARTLATPDTVFFANMYFRNEFVAQISKKYSNYSLQMNKYQ